MPVAVDEDADGRLPAVVEAAVAQSQLGSREPCPAGSAWWRAGLAETLARETWSPRRPPAYEAAPSPRSTRGATRA